MRYFRSTYCKQLTANKADANTYVSVKSTVTIITGRKEVVAKVMFLHVSVILFTGGGSPGRENPPDREEPPGQGEPPPNQVDPPGPGRPPGTRENPPPGRENPPGPGRPPREADSRIRSTSGRYTSYWNAFLLVFLCVLLYKR